MSADKKKRGSFLSMLKNLFSSKKKVERVSSAPAGPISSSAGQEENFPPRPTTTSFTGDSNGRGRRDIDDLIPSPIAEMSPAVSPASKTYSGGSHPFQVTPPRPSASGASTNSSTPTNANGTSHPVPDLLTASSVSSPSASAGAAADGALNDEELVAAVGELFSAWSQERVVSSKWDLRADAFKSIDKQLQGNAERASPSHETSRLFSVSSNLVYRAVRDKVAVVFFSGLNLLRTLIDSYFDKVSSAEVQAGMNKVVRALMKKVGDSNSRVHDSACQSMVVLLKHPALGLEQALPLVFKSVNNKAVHLLWGRLDLIRRLIAGFGLYEGSSGAGLSVDQVMSLTVKALEIPDDKVRKMAVHVTVDVYKAVGPSIRHHVKNLKPALLSVLDRKFQEADRVGDCDDSGLNDEDMEGGNGGGLAPLSVTGKKLPPLSVSGGMGRSAPIGRSISTSFPEQTSEVVLRHSEDSSVNLGSPHMSKLHNRHKGVLPPAAASSSLARSASVSNPLGVDKLSISKLEFEEDDEKFMDQILDDSGIAFK